MTDSVTYTFLDPFDVLAKADDDKATTIIIYAPRANQYRETGAIKTAFNAAYAAAGKFSAELKDALSDEDKEDLRQREQEDDDSDTYSADQVQQVLDMGLADRNSLNANIITLLTGSADVVCQSSAKVRFIDGMLANMSAQDLEGIITAFIANFTIAAWMKKTSQS